MIGVSLAYLRDESFEVTADCFLALQKELRLELCELHMEVSQFKCGFWHWDKSVGGKVEEIRREVKALGVHLPYLDLNPISGNPRLSRYALDTFKEAMAQAADLGASYVVFHARGRQDWYLRSAEMDLWRNVVVTLADFAHDRDLVFCFENADDVRSMDEVRELVNASEHVRLCLDLGHLYERVHERSRGARKVLGKLWDRSMPWIAATGGGLPCYDLGGFSAILKTFERRLHCVHVHNHNGRFAHQPLAAGKANVLKMVSQVVRTANVPVVLEADYRGLEIDQFRKDVALLREAIR